MQIWFLLITFDKLGLLSSNHCMQYLSDREILRGLRNFSEHQRNHVLKNIYIRFFPVIESYVVSNSGSTFEAADVFQDAIIVFYEKVRMEDFRMKSSIKTFLYAVSRNIWLNKIKKKSKVRYKGNFDDNNSEMDFEHMLIVESDERNDILIRLINTLGPKCRQILILYYYEGLSMKKIAQEMKFSQEQVAKNKKYKCLKKLRSIILNSEHLIDILK